MMPCKLPHLIKSFMALLLPSALALAQPPMTSVERVTTLAQRLPFAYYPSTSELEVAFDRASPQLRMVFGMPLPAVQVADAKPGLTFAYFEREDFSWKSNLPDFSQLTPMRRGVLDNISPRQLTDLPSGWGAVYAGYIEVPETGVYTFYARPYSKCQLLIAGHEVLNVVRSGTFNWRGGSVHLEAGRHELVLSQLGWEEWRNPELPPETIRLVGPGVAYQPLPDWMLSHGEDQSTGDRIAPRRRASNQQRVAMPLFDTVDVHVKPLRGGDPLFTGRLSLNQHGVGQARFILPELPEGEYAVEYVAGGAMIRASTHLRRIRFPWEGTVLGIDHRVYPPFERPRVTLNRVELSGRTYTLNDVGGFEQVVARDRPLLASPMRLVCETEEGEETWRVLNRVRGFTPQVDRAVFSSAVANDVVRAEFEWLIEEDGCARVDMTLSPVSPSRPIHRMTLEIPLRDEQVPLFHYVANHNLRFNYGGRTPRGGRIRWITEPSPTDWAAHPATWEVAEPGPDDGLIWHALQTRNNRYHPTDNTWLERYRGVPRDEIGDSNTFDNFVPYIWLGSVERGLAWFADTDRHFQSHADQPVQTISREGDRVILRIHIIQRPTVLTTPLTITYGLIASPTRPLPANPQGVVVPGGNGLPVVCWGGYWCADKYPDNRDFSVVDLRQEARRRDEQNLPPWSEQMQAALAHRGRNRAWMNSDVLGFPWDEAIKHWYPQNATYFEEHIIRQRSEEWQVFQDEWANRSFNRFLDEDAHWYVAATARSYHDFALYYANEWFARGVSLYFDNTFPKVDHNHYANGFQGRTFSYWAQRDYYRRIYKLMMHHNERAQHWPLHFTLHMTNTQVIPHTTWATATLDLEQGYRVDADRNELPFPIDYTQAVTLGRQAGVIAHAMYPLRNIGRFTFKDRQLTPQQEISDLGMYAVHELVRKNHWRETWFDSTTLVHDYRNLLFRYGFGDPGTRVHNYWADEPFLKIDRPDVAWIVLECDQQPQGLLLLQSYSPQAIAARVTLPSLTHLMDVETAEAFATDPTGVVHIPLAADYGTRMLILAAQPDHFPEGPLINASSRAP